MDHEWYIRYAIDLASKNVAQAIGGPFGALIVKGDEIIATGTNLVTRNNDPTAHAEIVAIRNACHVLHDFQLKECILYTSCEPCPMCFGAIFWARPKAVYFAATAQDAAKIDFDDAHIYDQLQKSWLERSIPFYNIKHHQRLEPFAMWDKSHTKITY